MLQKDANPRRVRYVQWRKDNAAFAEAVLAQAATVGEIRSSDFAREVPGRGQGWWDWKPEKIALEMLFMLGELTVSRRENFHRIYRRFEDQYPELEDATLPTEDDGADQHVRLAVRLGPRPPTRDPRDGLRRPVQPPPPELPVGRGPRRVLVGQRPPLAAGPQHVQGGVDEVPPVVLRRPSARCRGGRSTR